MSDENLIVGLETSDDAAVYKINEELALIQTLDFFTPVIDDPYMYGQIAAANSLSDIYAMGGEPKLAMNIVCFPDCLDPSVLTEILKGGYDKVKEAGALLVGGHSVSDDEPKYGLSVTGFVNPNKVMTNSNAKSGDVLILTKPIGLGVINTAIKGGVVDQKCYDIAVQIMSSLNKYAKEGMDKVTGINSVTDITGFGLLGHAMEMAVGSNVSIKIDHNKVPIIMGAIDYAKMGLVPAGTYTNKKHIEDKVLIKKDIPQYLEDLLYDPQTSGGLLISINKDNAEELMNELKNISTEYAIIGKVIDKEEYSIIVE